MGRLIWILRTVLSGRGPEGRATDYVWTDRVERARLVDERDRWFVVR